MGSRFSLGSGLGFVGRWPKVTQKDWKKQETVESPKNYNAHIHTEVENLKKEKQKGIAFSIKLRHKKHVIRRMLNWRGVKHIHCVCNCI